MQQSIESGALQKQNSLRRNKFSEAHSLIDLAMKRAGPFFFYPEPRSYDTYPPNGPAAPILSSQRDTVKKHTDS
jgi:hypothetical protein